MKQPWLTPETLERLKQAYRHALDSFEGPGSSHLWTAIANKQQDIHNALLADDESLVPLLADPGQTYLYYGVDHHYRDFQESTSRESLCLSLENQIRERLPVLGEAIGAIRCWNPAPARFPNRIPVKPEYDLEELLSSIEAKLGVPLHFPKAFPNEIGLATSHGHITMRAVDALYQAFRLKQVVSGENRCLEIGGGMGRTALFANMLGLKDYTVIDLPMTMVGQALFLMATLGPDAVWLAGEPLEGQSRPIRLVPPAYISETQDRFDAVLNVDSFTEMDPDHANAYIEFSMDRSNVLLSINHEGNDFTVHELARNHCHARFPYWLRPGYVEEIYRPGRF